MVSLAIVIVKLTSRSRRQLAHSNEGFVVLSIRDPKPVASSRGEKKLALATANQQKAVELDQKVDDAIRRLILMN
jgi:hypothetical protein